MSDRDDSGNSGNALGITREHTVWCNRCSNWLQLPEHRKSAFIATIKRGGWKRISGYWNCAKCAKKASKQ